MCKGPSLPGMIERVSGGHDAGDRIAGIVPRGLEEGWLALRAVAVDVLVGGRTRERQFVGCNTDHGSIFHMGICHDERPATAGPSSGVPYVRDARDHGARELGKRVENAVVNDLG